MEERNYTYMVRCRDGSLYTGWTNRLEERIKAHNEGRGAKYTRGRGPVELVYYESFDTKKEAMSREAGIKKMKKREKEALILANGLSREETGTGRGRSVQAFISLKTQSKSLPPNV